MILYLTDIIIVIVLYSVNLKSYDYCWQLYFKNIQVIKKLHKLAVHIMAGYDMTHTPGRGVCVK